MKAQVLTGSQTENVSRVRLSTLILGSVIMVLLFSIVYIRQMSIRTGYDISSMMNQIEKKDIEYTALLDKRSESYDSEHLYNRAKELEMVLPDVKRTFYVKE